MKIKHTLAALSVALLTMAGKTFAADDQDDPWKVAVTLPLWAPRIDGNVTIDGIKAYFDDGWILVRPSGTEPICRIYGESRSNESAQALMAHGVALVSAATNELAVELGSHS